ncbi:MAG TPA: malate dehydrogenase [Gammaproteobacteria bacterium]|nr:malate dehydrogenase [Gammaproteobacteria bacterium]
MQKITIVGAGRVGESTAQFLASMDITRELVLLDVQPGLPEGAALDIQQTAPLFEFDTQVTGATDPQAMMGSDLVIVTAGIARKPGMSRSDVLETNVKILDSIVDQVMRYAPDAMLMLVSNPVDVLTYRAWQRTGWNRSRVFGQAGVLDSSRMAAFIALETGYSAKDIDAMVLGGHGDAMVPMIRYTTISGIGVEQLLSKAQIEQIIERTRNGGAEVLALRKTSSAYSAPAAAISEMVDAIARNRQAILPAISVLKGEYGYRDVAMGVPCVFGMAGMQHIVELELTDAERAQFDTSLAGVQADLKRLKGH